MFSTNRRKNQENIAITRNEQSKDNNMESNTVLYCKITTELIEGGVINPLLDKRLK